MFSLLMLIDLLDLRAILSFVIPYVAIKLENTPQQLFDPFYSCTLVGESILAKNQ